MNVSDLSPQDVLELLPPRSPAMALLVNGTWLFRPGEGIYQLRVTVNRLGNYQPMALGHVDMRVWESKKGPAARSDVWTNAYNHHTNGPKVRRQQAEAPVTTGRALLAPPNEPRPIG